VITYFKNANEFIGFKRSCLMCGSSLKPIVSNFTTMSGGIPSIKSNYDKNNFDFKIDYNSSTTNVNCEVIIDCQDNVVKFIEKECQLIDPQKKDILAFEMMDLHFENYCTNKECKHKYYISSDILRIDKNLTECTLKPIKLYCESFSVGKITVFNDYHNRVTNIFSNRKRSADKIEVAILDFSGLDRQKILNKVKTLVNFS
jgi:hypothetical protein